MHGHQMSMHAATGLYMYMHACMHAACVFYILVGVVVGSVTVNSEALIRSDEPASFLTTQSGLGNSKKSEW